MSFSAFVLTTFASFLGTLAAAGAAILIVRMVDGRQGRPQ